MNIRTAKKIVTQNGGDKMKTYKIIRFKFKEDSEVIKIGLTLEEAQKHCNSEETHGENWFDGYTEE